MQGAALERIQDLTSTLIRALKETSKKLRAVLNPPDGTHANLRLNSPSSHAALAPFPSPEIPF